ncbi:hypothetical protein [Bradyrhizobium sp. HKCCYLR20261]|uniref:hypothetical protein n=1 Tax=Bradyrhizobium sp. HKCCYLR20261 TaxID=3420760 RepID=UPI003EBAECAE
MSASSHVQEFWEGKVIAWLLEHAGLRRERIDLKRKFTQEPYNLSVVRVLTMMDEFIALHNEINQTRLVLSQNWRLAHRGDTVGDFIHAFCQVVASTGIISATDDGASSSAPMSETRQGRVHNQRLEALRADPRRDWKPVDLEIIASQYAMKFRKITGTHEVFLHPSVPHCVTIPLKAPIRPPHIRAFVAMIDGMDEAAR